MTAIPLLGVINRWGVGKIAAQKKAKKRSKKAQKKTRKRHGLKGSPRTAALLAEIGEDEVFKPLPVGRPTKWNPQFCQMLVDHAAGGFSFESFGAMIGVCGDTLYRWAKVKKEFSEAKKKAYIVSLRFWESIMITGIDRPSPSWTPSIAIFNAKCRFPNQYRDDPKGLDDRMGDVEEEADEEFTASW